MIRIRRWVAAAAFLGLFACSAAQAHDGLPAALTIQEVSEHVYLAQVSLPPRLANGAPPALVLPRDCAAGAVAPQAPTGRRLYRCARSLAGREIRLVHRAEVPAVPTLARVEWLSGKSQTQLMPAGETRIVLPEPETPVRVATQYFHLGVHHILTGYDHLLFLACLLLLSRRRILLTVTGFTAGHAITITAASLGASGPPTRAVESAIALSIVFIAAEIARPRRDTYTWRWPVLVSSMFGLLHGLGFASALRDTGLPHKDAPLALLSFNLGVEAGQLVFVLGCVGLWLAGRRLPATTDLDAARLSTPVAYVVGCLAAYWFIQRTVAI